MRLRGGVQPYSGYLEVSYSDEWGFVCDSGSWTMAEANIVCKQLGFGRGIRSTTQGTFYSRLNDIKFDSNDLILF